MEDKDLLAGLFGIAGIVTSEIITQIATELHLARYSDAELASLMITYSKPNFYLGMVVSLTVGSILAFICYRAFKVFNNKHLIIKCISVGVLMWIFLETLVTFSLEGTHIKVRSEIASAMHLLGAIGYGATVGIFFRVFLFKSDGIGKIYRKRI